MTQDLTPEAVAKMLEGVTPGPWTSDVCRNVWGSAPGSHGKIANLSDRPQAEGYDEIPEASVAANARFIAWAREAVPALAAKLAEVERDRDELRAAKWAEKHTDTMNDMVQMGMARDEAMTRADLSAAREAAARREGWDAAIEAAAAKVEGMSRTRTYTDEDLGTMTARNLVKPSTVSAAILAMKETE
jgi:hypothetical protein